MHPLRPSFHTKTLLLLWVSFAGLWACRQTNPAPAIVAGTPEPLSQPGERIHASLSVRLIERIDKSPGSSGTGPLHFGSAIALHGDMLAVGAPESSGLGNHQIGKVYVFQRQGDTWAELPVLEASDRDDAFQANLHFGTALAMEGGFLVVGAPEARHREAGYSVGAVYIFRRTGDAWVESQILHASDRRINDRFGDQLVLRDGVLLVRGGQSVYVFERTGGSWSEVARLAREGGHQRDRFGHHMAVSGDRLAVDALAYDPELERYVSSEIHLFGRTVDGWALQEKLSPGTDDGLSFLYSLDLQGNTLAVGSAADAAGFMSGAVYIYEAGPVGWVQQARLVPADGWSSSFLAFGSSVDLEGDLLAVGAAGDSGQGLWSGSAYLFQLQGDSWVDMRKLWPVEEDYLGAFYGADLEISGDTLLIAAPAEFGRAVYLYQIHEAESGGTSSKLIE